MTELKPRDGFLHVEVLYQDRDLRPVCDTFEIPANVRRLIVNTNCAAGVEVHGFDINDEQVDAEFVDRGDGMLYGG
jgi:hypothetical protein